MIRFCCRAGIGEEGGMFRTFPFFFGGPFIYWVLFFICSNTLHTNLIAQFSNLFGIFFFILKLVSRLSIFLPFVFSLSSLEQVAVQLPDLICPNFGFCGR